MTKRTAAYGSWESPITTRSITKAGVTFSEIVFDGDSVYWLEGRPLEEGRAVVVRRDVDGTIADITPPGFDARTSVHEYGGASYTVRDGTVFFANFPDQRLYRQDPRGQPQPITPEPDIPRGLRYADMRATPDGRFILCVHERHRADDEPVNELIAVPADGASRPVVIATGRDFYSNPRLTPDGAKLCWLAWDHPHMPFDGTELLVCDFDPQVPALVGEPRLVAGGPQEAIVQPEWGPTGELTFSSDRTSWWNLYHESDGAVEPIPATSLEADFGGPAWRFGNSYYAFLDDGRMACAYWQGGLMHLAVVSADGSALTGVDSGLTAFGPPMLSSDGTKLWAVAGNWTTPPAVVSIDPADGAVDVVRTGGEESPDPGYISIPQAITYPTEEGLTAHGFYFPPQNAEFQGPQGEQPPLIVTVHGGPTSAVRPYLSSGIQYFTSRGFAVVDLNYGGSTGFGRAYRERLYGQWGVVDVDDAVNAARFLADQGEVDGSRIAIRGGSAGGFTTIMALTFRDRFSAGACYFGLSDLELFAETTHKFESHYLDELVGPYPENADLYRERSAIHHADQLRVPMIWLQGSEDKVVPPSQAEVFIEAMQRRGIPHAYLVFEGEGHGFRSAKSLKRAYEAELSFFSQVFGFVPADEVEMLDLGP